MVASDCHPAFAPISELREAVKNTDWVALHAEGKTTCPADSAWSANEERCEVLRRLCTKHNATHVLEVGAFCGVSSLSMAEGIPADGSIVSLEIDPFMADFCKPYMSKVEYGNKINYIIGPALETLKDLANQCKDGTIDPFDFLFIDADQNSLMDYFNFFWYEAPHLLGEQATVCLGIVPLNGQAAVLKRGVSAGNLQSNLPDSPSTQDRIETLRQTLEVSKEHSVYKVAGLMVSHSKERGMVGSGANSSLTKASGNCTHGTCPLASFPNDHVKLIGAPTWVARVPSNSEADLKKTVVAQPSSGMKTPRGNYTHGTCPLSSFPNDHFKFIGAPKWVAPIPSNPEAGLKKTVVAQPRSGMKTPNGNYTHGSCRLASFPNDHFKFIGAPKWVAPTPSSPEADLKKIIGSQPASCAITPNGNFTHGTFPLASFPNDHFKCMKAPKWVARVPSSPEADLKKTVVAQPSSGMKTPKGNYTHGTCPLASFPNDHVKFIGAPKWVAPVPSNSEPDLKKTLVAQPSPKGKYTRGICPLSSFPNNHFKFIGASKWVAPVPGSPEADPKKMIGSQPGSCAMTPKGNFTHGTCPLASFPNDHFKCMNAPKWVAPVPSNLEAGLKKTLVAQPSLGMKTPKGNYTHGTCPLALFPNDHFKFIGALKWVARVPSSPEADLTKTVVAQPGSGIKTPKGNYTHGTCPLASFPNNHVKFIGAPKWVAPVLSNSEAGMKKMDVAQPSSGMKTHKGNFTHGTCPLASFTNDHLKFIGAPKWVAPVPINPEAHLKRSAQRQ